MKVRIYLSNGDEFIFKTTSNFFNTRGKAEAEMEDLMRRGAVLNVKDATGRRRSINAASISSFEVL